MKKTTKRLITLVFAVCLALSAATAAFAAVTAVPTKSAVQIDNKAVDFEAYNIGGNNYFKLRDLAMALNGTGKRFSVVWDAEANAVRLTAPGSYIPVGGELAVSGGTSAVKAVATTSTVYANGRAVSLTAYNIGGYNYFMLRDIGRLFDFGVSYDEKGDTVKVDTQRPYYIANLLAVLEGAYYSPAGESTAYGRILYNKTATGNITVDIYSDTRYTVRADNISGAGDLEILSRVIGTFVNDPAQVVDAMEASKNEGRKTMEVDGRTIVCYAVGAVMTAEIYW